MLEENVVRVHVTLGERLALSRDHIVAVRRSAGLVRELDLAMAKVETLSEVYGRILAATKSLIADLPVTKQSRWVCVGPGCSSMFEVMEPGFLPVIVGDTRGISYLGKSTHYDLYCDGLAPATEILVGQGREVLPVSHYGVLKLLNMP